ncbi:MAG: hypothetical protein AAGU18_08805 [Proteiniphilum sp.]
MTSKKIMLFCLFLVFILSARSQIKIIDETTNQPIPFVHVFTDDGKLGVVSNLKGMITEKDVSLLTLDMNATLIIQHVVYSSKQVKASDLVHEKEIFLSARSINLDEIVVTPQKHPYIHVGLKGFFRSYVLLNNEPKYYVDGIATYYLSKKSQKVRMELHQYRVFRNEEIVANEKKNFFISIDDRPGLPDIKTNTLIHELGDGYQLETSESGYSIVHKDSTVGYFSYSPDAGPVIMHVDRMAPDSMKSFGLGRFRIQKQKWLNSAQYLSYDEYNVEAKDLESFKEFYTTRYSFDRDKTTFEIQCLQELFIFERNYLNKLEMKQIKTTTNRKIPLKHLIVDKYWNNLKGYNIPEIDPNFGKRLGKSLKMY